MSAVHSVVHFRCTYSTDLPLTARIDILEASPFTLWETSIIGQRLRHGRDSIGIGTQTATSAQVLKWQMLEWFHQGEPEVESKVVDEAFRKKKIYRVHSFVNVSMNGQYCPPKKWLVPTGFSYFHPYGNFWASPGSHQIRAKRQASQELAVAVAVSQLTSMVLMLDLKGCCF